MRKKTDSRNARARTSDPGADPGNGPNDATDLTVKSMFHLCFVNCQRPLETPEYLKKDHAANQSTSSCSKTTIFKEKKSASPTHNCHRDMPQRTHTIERDIAPHRSSEESRHRTTSEHAQSLNLIIFLPPLTSCVPSLQLIIAGLPISWTFFTFR